MTQNQWVFFASWVLALALLITMSCSTRVRRKYPLNYCFLVVFTLVRAPAPGRQAPQRLVHVYGDATNNLGAGLCRRPPCTPSGTWRARTRACLHTIGRRAVPACPCLLV